MGEKVVKKKLIEVFDFKDGEWCCKTCIFTTPHEWLARHHCQVEHLVELEPIKVALPKKGEPKEEFEFVEED